MASQQRCFIVVMVLSTVIAHGWETPEYDAGVHRDDPEGQSPVLLNDGPKAEAIRKAGQPPPPPPQGPSLDEVVTEKVLMMLARLGLKEQSLTSSYGRMLTLLKGFPLNETEFNRAVEIFAQRAGLSDPGQGNAADYKFWVEHTDPNLQLLQDHAAMQHQTLDDFLHALGHTPHSWTIRDFKEQFNVELTEPLHVVLEKYKAEKQQREEEESKLKAELERHGETKEQEELVMKAMKEMVYNYQDPRWVAQCQGAHALFAELFTKMQRRHEQMLENHQDHSHYRERGHADYERYGHHHDDLTKPNDEPKEKKPEEEWQEERERKGKKERPTASKHHTQHNANFSEAVTNAILAGYKRLQRRSSLVVINAETLHLLPTRNHLDERFMKVHIVDPDLRFPKHFQPHSLVDAHEGNPHSVVLRPNQQFARHSFEAYISDEDVTMMVCAFFHYLHIATSTSADIEEAVDKIRNVVMRLEWFPRNAPKKIIALQDADMVIATDVTGAMATAMLHLAFRQLTETFKHKYEHLYKDEEVPAQYLTQERFMMSLRVELTFLKRFLAERFVKTLAHEVPAGGVVVFSYPIKTCFDYHWRNGTVSEDKLCQREEDNLQETIRALAKEPLYQTQALLVSHADVNLDEVERDNETNLPTEIFEVTTLVVATLQWGEPREPNKDDVPYFGDDWEYPVSVEPDYYAYDPEHERMQAELEEERRRNQQEEEENRKRMEEEKAARRAEAEANGEIFDEGEL